MIWSISTTRSTDSSTKNPHNDIELRALCHRHCSVVCVCPVDVEHILCVANNPRALNRPDELVGAAVVCECGPDHLLDLPLSGRRLPRRLEWIFSASFGSLYNAPNACAQDKGGQSMLAFESDSELPHDMSGDGSKRAEWWTGGDEGHRLL